MLNTAKDLSHGSDELLGLISDEFTRQHLSPERANFLQPFREILRGHMLVTGAATGPVARFLAQFGETVIAVEPSSTEAALAAARCRDLENVQVHLGGGLSGFPNKAPYDVIVAIPPADTSVEPENFLEGLRRSLAPGGLAILAVNNSLGMASFLNARGPNDGWRLSKGTFDEALAAAGFGNTKLYCAFPDAIFSRLLIGPNWSADLPGVETILAASDGSRRASNSRYSESLWKSVLTNDLLRHLSSSFVILASLQPLSVSAEDDRMWVYSTRRRKHFSKVVVFREGCGEVTVSHQPLFGDAAAPRDSHIRRRFYDAPYVIGTPYLAELRRILSRENWHVEEIAVWARQWLELLEAKAFDETFRGYIGAPTHLRVLPPDYIDCIPDNILVGSQGELIPIDFEYEAVAPIPIKFVIFRGLYQALSEVSTASLADPIFNNIASLVLEVMRLAGYLLNEDELRNYVDIEASLQDSVAATPPSRTATGLRTARIRLQADSNVSLVESHAEGDVLQLFWKTEGTPYDEAASASAAIFPGGNRQLISVAIPPVNPPPDSLRLDPCTRTGMFHLSAMRLFDAAGDCIWTWDGDGAGFVERQLLTFADATFGGGAIAFSEGGDPTVGLPVRPEVLRRLKAGGRLEVEMTWPEMPDLLQLGHRFKDGAIYRERIRSLEAEVRALAVSRESEASLRAELARAKSWTASCAEAQERLTAEATGYKKALATLELDNSSLREENSRLGALAETQERLTTEAAGYKEELTRLRREHRVLQKENERLAAEMHSMRFNSEQTLVSTNILNRDLKDQLSVMKEELTNVRGQRYALQVENRVLAAEIERIDRLEQQVAEIYQSRIWRTLVALSSPFNAILGGHKK